MSPISPLQIEVKEQITSLLTAQKFTPPTFGHFIGKPTQVVEDIIENKRPYPTGVLNNILDKIEGYAGKHNLIEEVEQYQTIWNTARNASQGKKQKSGRYTPNFDLLVGGSGLGKSEVLKVYALQHSKHVYMVRLDKGVNWRELLESIAVAMGVLSESQKMVNRNHRNLHSGKILALITRKLEEQVVDEAFGNFPVLIIDEAEEIPMGTLRKLKNLYTATEGLLSIIISGINETKLDLYKLAGMKPDGSLKDQLKQNDFTPFVRRMNIVNVPPISFEDLTLFCAKQNITNKKALNIIYTSGQWWNYQIAHDMVNHYGAETFQELSTEKAFKALCSEFI